MKVNLPLLKLISRLLILLIMFVVLFLISAVLYSARYWHDMYNYAHPNITITHIPTITELNLTEITTEVYTITEMYTTTDLYSFENESTTDYFGLDDIFGDDFLFESKIRKRNVRNDAEEPVLVDYFFDYRNEDKNLENDVIKETNLNTGVNMNDVEIIGEENNSVEVMAEELKTTHSTCRGSADDVIDILAPWIAAIFVKNDTNQQFDYVCDGAVLYQRTVITAANCLTRQNLPLNARDILVILGKKSLQGTSQNEHVYRAEKVKIHPDFNGTIHDMALIIIEGDLNLNEDVQFACLEGEGTGEAVDALTTGWKVSGELSPIYFESSKSNCKNEMIPNLICTSYEEGTTCPSHGGIFATRHNESWFLTGIRTSDPSERGLCFGRDVEYTDLKNYKDWFSEKENMNFD